MNIAKQQRNIFAFVADLYFASRIEQAAAGLGFNVHWFEFGKEIDPGMFSIPGRQLAEHVVGPGAVLIEKLTDLQPALVIFDLNDNHIPWQSWIALIKSSPATRRIPVLCFGSHKDLEAFKAARSHGADAVVARSRFVEGMPALIEKMVRKIDIRALQESCEALLDDKAILGIEEFNRGEYFEAHESLEIAWNKDHTPGRELYRAILQISVAYLQITRRNYPGAIKMFLRSRQWIDPLPDTCRGVNVAKLRTDSAQVYQAIKELGPEGLSDFDLGLLKPVEYTDR